MTVLGIAASAHVEAVAAPVLPLSITWHSAFWAEDPGWTPPANGGAVSSWRNAGTSAANATQATGTLQPTYQAAYANLNNKPVVLFDGTSDALDTASAAAAQPNHVFVVGWLDPTHGASPHIFDSISGSGRHYLRNLGTGGNILLYAGVSVQTVGGGRDGAFALAALYDGASSSVRMNGTVYTLASTVGTNSFTNLRLCNSASAGTSWYKGAIAFFGLKDTALTVQEITDLEDWAETYYGVPIP